MARRSIFVHSVKKPRGLRCLSRGWVYPSDRQVRAIAGALRKAGWKIEENRCGWSHGPTFLPLSYVLGTPHSGGRWCPAVERNERTVARPFTAEELSALQKAIDEMNALIDAKTRAAFLWPPVPKLDLSLPPFELPDRDRLEPLKLRFLYGYALPLRNRHRFTMMGGV